MEREKRKCKRCSKEFSPKHKAHKFCSSKCKNYYNMKEWLKNPKNKKRYDEQMKPIRIKHSNKKRAEWKEKGLCSQCGKAKQDKNKSYCNKCRDYFRAYKEKNKK